ncbi:hypothetical protein H1D32_11530 [Anaerobacillus sp. CMMVII]|nr:hypothetical protein [Anaerobacillus sp. CMMVII]MCT8138324.1 hypothetical protein [Anaerobacillus sp. CMMVII]
MLEQIIDQAKDNYEILVLHTDTVSANIFNTSLGFIKEAKYPNSSHWLAV